MVCVRPGGNVMSAGAVCLWVLYIVHIVNVTHTLEMGGECALVILWLLNAQSLHFAYFV